MATFRPNSRPQELFLGSPCDIAVYGGSAGGGKTRAILMECLRHVANPGFGAVVFRRTSPQITSEGGLWDEAGKVFPRVGGVQRVGDLQYAFPGGSKVTFKHLQHEKTKYDWQGSQVPLICFDELTHFSESQFFYLLSRNRSTCGVRPYVRATTNPDASSWVKRFLAPWVDRKSPDPAASGEVRWFVRINGEILWARSKAGLQERFAGCRPKSVTFVRARVHDNVDLLRLDPDYLANLMAQSPVERARLLDGDWDVVNDGLVYPDFGTCVVEPEGWPAAIHGREWGGIDWGWNNPFAALRGTLDGDDVLWVSWLRYGSRMTLSEHSREMPRIEGLRWWGDPAGADQVAEMRAAGHDVVPCVHLGQKPLENGIARVADRIRTGRLKVRGDLGHLIEEAGKYRYDGRTEKPVDADNHALGALRYMVVGIDRGRAVDDRPPEESAEEREARLAAEADARRAEAEARSAAHHDPDNDYWWN